MEAGCWPHPWCVNSDPENARRGVLAFSIQWQSGSSACASTPLVSRTEDVALAIVGDDDGVETR
jgi:hypothetical protein